MTVWAIGAEPKELVKASDQRPVTPRKLPCSTFSLQILFDSAPIRLTNSFRYVKVARLAEMSCCLAVETALTTLHPLARCMIFVSPV